jgi:hypothetical protein
MTDTSALIYVAAIAGSMVALALILGVVLVLVRVGGATLGRQIADGWSRLRGHTPWLPRGRALTLLGATHGQHTTAFVSRHHLAAGGLMCPLCQTVVADAGDFSKVYRTIVDGRENECIVCTGEREVGDRMMPCATLLLASPDTEHGDHLDGNGDVDAKGIDPPSYYRFVRVGAEQALREKWGVEVAGDDRGDLMVAAATEPVSVPVRADDISSGRLCADPAKADTEPLPTIKE